MKAVILAGGLGTRLKPFTEVIPKPLLPLGESSVLEIQVRALKRAGFDEVFIATNYMADYVEAFLGDGSKYGIRITFSRESVPLGTCGPVKPLQDQLFEPFLLMNGDILTTLDFRVAWESAVRSDANLTVFTKEVKVPFNFGKVVSDGPYIVEVTEKPDLHFEILAGIYLLKPPVLELIPHGTYYGIDSLIKEMLARKMRIGRELITDYWLDIGELNDFQTARDAFAAHSQFTRDTSSGK
jgi:NDP-sugar pyrophosphorylase family protein